jgi:glycine amidinotransferase
MKLQAEGKTILTEAEIAFDAADAMRFGKDIFIALTQVLS